MRRLLLLLAVSASGLFASAPAFAQTAGAQVLPNGCGTAGYAGKTNMQPLTQDTNGNLCGSGSGGGGTGQGVYVLPQSAAAAAIAPVGAANASSFTLKNAAGNFYDAYVTTSSTPGYIYVFNAISAPLNGAVTFGTASGNYQECVTAGPNTTTSVAYAGEPPESFSVGITLVFSTTSCGTLTAGSVPLIRGRVK